MYRIKRLAPNDLPEHTRSDAIAASRGLQFSPILLAIYLSVMMTYGILRLTNQTELIAFLTVLTVVLMCATSLVHMVESHGLRRAAIMAAGAFSITLAAELVGVATGALYGQYAYSDNLGVKVLGLVPLVVPLAWLMMLYPAFETTKLLFPHTSQSSVPTPLNLSRYARVLLAGTAAAAMTAWDLSLDPRMVSDGNWTWQNGGEYFGIPLSNFAGWLVTAFAIYLFWLIVTARQQAPARPMLRGLDALIDRLSGRSGGMTRHLARPLRSTIWTSLPVYIYIMTWLSESIVNVVLWRTPLVGLAVFIGMGVFCLPALLRLWQTHGDMMVTLGQSLRGRVMRVRPTTSTGK